MQQPCDSPPTLAVSFARITKQLYPIASSGASFPSPPSPFSHPSPSQPADFSLGPLSTDPTRCLSAITGMDLGIGSNAVILGEVFFKSTYVVLDIRNGRIGLGRPKWA